MAEEEVEEVILEGVGLTPRTTDIPLASLSEDKQLALTVKASIDTVWEESGPGG